jgi:hypothetical protein
MGDEWLPGVEFEGVEYMVHVQNRCFSQLTDPTENVGECELSFGGGSGDGQGNAWDRVAGVDAEGGA